MKNIRINITEDKFRILLENWSRYRSEEISPLVGTKHGMAGGRRPDVPLPGYRHPPAPHLVFVRVEFTALLGCSELHSYGVFHH